MIIPLQLVRRLHLRSLILGIETSCDDCGAAILDSRGNILGERVHSQLEMHIRFGGIVPEFARLEHRSNVAFVVSEALKNASLELSDLDAIAVTNRPGLKWSLKIGSAYALKLSKRVNKPIIPVHHMRAHALTAQMFQRVKFPFLCLLISGGHCLLTVAHSISDFHILGSTSDIAPGEVFDKIARRLKMKNLGGPYSKMSGGHLLETLSEGGNPFAFNLKSERCKNPNMLRSHVLDSCEFNLGGLKNRCLELIDQLELEEGVDATGVIEKNRADFCASAQHAVLQHLAVRLMLAMEFCEAVNAIPEGRKTLVISGGVACNKYLGQALSWVASHYGYRTVIPPPKLCTDNGVMIAWTGALLYNAGVDVLSDLPDGLKTIHRCPIGSDLRSLVKDKSSRFAKPQAVDLTEFVSLWRNKEAYKPLTAMLQNNLSALPETFARDSDIRQAVY